MSAGVPTPEEAIAARADAAMQNWPTLDRAYGCENCRALFREPDNARCPCCRSESVFDAAAVLARKAVSVERLQPIVEMLDAELALASEVRA